MKKLFSILIAASFATVSAAAFAGAHGGAPKDGDMKKMEEKMEACKKMDAKTADDKMKAECKKMMEEKKPEAPKK
jgi:type IV secretory pathway TrbL component